ncbi:MAG TPA: phosphomethylpyrimidine synthase ThiC [Polyangiaceae bacterium]|nr:phosphomethylpyrimidine synthase ThiC [Polyangiaceae bacterium]
MNRAEAIARRKNSPNQSQMHFARKGIITEEMAHVANDESIDPAMVRDEVAAGRLVMPANIHHLSLQPVGIGMALRCKVNANIGNSELTGTIETELDKLRISVRYGADTVMDLSTGGDIDAIREGIIANSTVPIGTVPIYHALESVSSIRELTVDKILGMIEHQAKQGVDYMTLHCGLLREHLPLVRRRLTGIVSRGGAIMAQWMLEHDAQNPLYTHWSDILEICARYDVTISAGDGLRPGSQHDASDEAQFAELTVLGQLADRAWDKDVQIMIEGPGHVPFDQIEMNVKRQIQACKGAPFYVLGPIVTDVAPGYDHITSAIGATAAAYAGAAMICYVTPKEHLGLPNLEDVRQGLVAHKIAAHAADIARHRPGARTRDDEMSKARYAFDWERQFELALDPETARSYHLETKSEDCYISEDFCSMCGPRFCSMRLNRMLEERYGS